MLSRMGHSKDARIRSVRSPQDAAARKGGKDSVFPARNPPPLHQGEGCASGLIPMNLEKGLLGPTGSPSSSRPHWQYWRGVVPLSGGFPAADAGAPFANSLFYRESPCGRSVNRESVCRGAQRRRRMQPAKCRAFSSACHAFRSWMIWPQLETSE